MVIILMRHGDAEPPGGAKERGLTEKGRRDAASVGRLLLKAGFCPEIIYHSGKLRAAQTAAILAEAGQKASLQKIAGLAPHDDVLEIADELERAVIPTAVVGHMPHLTNLVFQLCGNQEIPPFGTAHAAVLERIDSAWEVQQIIRPLA